ncbi:ABC transporter permease [Sulfolobus tengchongensis]|uniref:ABC transporter permease n=1 Tax=Sulfolobus tengchongensis TaxID=207809 RepID=A0AAX4KZA7_9CREN
MQLTKYSQLIINVLNSVKGAVGLGIIVCFSLFPFLRPLITKYPPEAVGVGAPNQPPSSLHPFGTTSLGQDVLSQFLTGGLIPIEVGILTGILTSILVIVIGIPAGYYAAKYSGKFLTLITDIFLLIPALPLIILLGVYLGPSLLNQVLVLTLISWPFPARVVASQVMSLKERGFILSAKVIGASDTGIMFNEILPNVINLIISNSILVIIFAILFQAALSFLGLGVPTQPNWGNMLYYALQSGAIASGEWWWVLPPGIGIFMVAFAFSLLFLRLEEVLGLEVS